MSDRKMCEVVLDLLPLYVDGDCSQGSKETVEKHLKGCPNCMKQFDSMTKDFPVVNVSEKDIKMKQMFRKIWVSVVVVSLVLVFVFSPLIYNWRELMHYGPRLTDENREDVKNMEHIMEVWQEEGYEAAINEMEPKLLYEELCEPIPIERWIERYFWEDWEYKSIELANQVIYTRSLNLENDIPVTEAQVEQQEALENKDYAAFWKSVMEENEGQLIVTKEIYDMVVEKYPEFLEENWYQMNRESGTYYYYWNSEDETLAMPSSRFSKDMYEKVEDMEEQEQEFFFMADVLSMPEELYQEFVQICTKVEGWLAEYTNYYRELGYYNFEKQWRKEMIALVKELEDDGIVLEEYDFDYDRDIYQGTDIPHAWRFRFHAAFSKNQNIYLYLFSKDGCSFLSHANVGFGMYEDYELLLEKEKQKLEEVTEKLNYSKEKYEWRY